ncbi:hypothetical protein HUK65_03310 [Rhodobacteraceae bacterium 2376]|uniref:EF-hand domain-containing protein n=1 Tax=Rhabdonatronobacter sediminivivens TaxID=2743469 RepID=A0A7Z0KWA7_9RHOB|nr:hypothetical protein [Rhabdonatronobacter sediminivivens]NYS24007.1 hypothetical protein [Rhabdonatronobacter sediminivivens]
MITSNTRAFRMLALGALALGLGTAMAEARSHGWQSGADWPAFEELDAAGDGVISRAEFGEFIESRMAERQENRAARMERARDARLDAMVDHLMQEAEDGTLDAEALRAGLESWMADQRAQMETRRAARAEGGTRGERAGQMPRRGWHRSEGSRDPARANERMFDRIDSDGDGVISPAEYDAAVERMAERAARRGAGRDGAAD